MIVTDKKYFLDNTLIKQLNLMAKRCTGKHKLDNVIIVDGYEGYGKTTLSVACAYYLSYITGRPFPPNCSNMFFDIEKLIEFAGRTKDQIIIWDEAALGGLSREHYKKTQIKLIKLLMTSRKKRHIYFFNIPRFFRLSTGIIERAIALLHVYVKQGTRLGYFTYYKQSFLEKLFEDWASKRKKNYRKYYLKPGPGTFPNVLSKIVDEKTYDKLKDEAIIVVTNQLTTRTVSGEKLIRFQYKYSKIKGHTNKELSEDLGVSPATISDWRKLPKKYPDLFREPPF